MEIIILRFAHSLSLYTFICLYVFFPPSFHHILHMSYVTLLSLLWFAFYQLYCPLEHKDLEGCIHFTASCLINNIMYWFISMCLHLLGCIQETAGISRERNFMQEVTEGYFQSNLVGFSQRWWISWGTDTILMKK